MPLKSEKTNTTHYSYLDEFLVALPPLVGHAGQVRVSLLAVAAHDTAVVELVLA